MQVNQPLPDKSVTIIGQTRGRHPQRVFGINNSDLLQHVFIIGQTGTGKSSLMAKMMRQHDAQGVGYCLIDQHGDLAKAIASELTTDHIYWNVADPDCPFGYNPLTYAKVKHRPVIASSFIDTLKHQWADAWGARMEHLLRYSVLALLERPSSTLQDIMPLFLNKGFRFQVLADVEDPQVKRFWTSEYPAMNFKNAVDGVAPIANKLGAFLAHPVVRKAVCDPEEPLRFRKIMDEGTPLIVNLSKGRLGADNANLIGGLIVSKLAHAAYSREDQPQAQRNTFFAYLDEFQSITSGALAEMPSEVRKYGLGLVFACQHTSRLSPQVLEALLGNVGTLISFRVGAIDAAILSRQFGGDRPQPHDLVNLANYEIFIKQMISGAQSKPFSAFTVSNSG